MPWTAEFISQSDFQNLVDDGTLKKFYDDSKDHIEDGKNYSAYPYDLNEDDKFNHWVATFKAFIDGNIIEEGNYNYYVLVHKLDDDPKLIHAAWYNSDKNAFCTAHSLNRYIDGSKAWAFDEPCWIPAVNLAKNLGATKWEFHSTIGGSISFRIKTGRGAPNVFDYDSMVQEEIDEVKEVVTTAEAAPTEDNTTKDNDETKVIISNNEMVTTINFK